MFFCSSSCPFFLAVGLGSPAIPLTCSFPLPSSSVSLVIGFHHILEATPEGMHNPFLTSFVVLLLWSKRTGFG